MKLTKTQRGALRKLAADGALYPGNGVSVTTATALVSRGLAQFEVWNVQHTNNPSSGRNHWTVDWKLVAAPTEEAEKK